MANDIRSQLGETSTMEGKQLATMERYFTKKGQHKLPRIVYYYKLRGRRNRRAQQRLSDQL
jgi:hypothetical protein